MHQGESDSLRERERHIHYRLVHLEHINTNYEQSRWWFASTAFPLIAGTFGPMASAFSICALVVHWRVAIPPGGAEEHATFIPDPKW